MKTKILITVIARASLGTELLKALSLAGQYEIYGADISKTAYGLYDHGFAETFIADNNYFGRLNLGTGRLISTKKAAEIIRDYVHSSSAIEYVDMSEYAPNSLLA